MDIKVHGLGSSPVLPAQKLELPEQQIHAAFYPPLSLRTDEIIDYIEIQSNNYQPASTPPSSHPIRTDKPAQAKGTFIDVWI